MAINPTVYTLPSMVTGNSVTSSFETPGVFLYTFLEVPTMPAAYTAASTPIYLQTSTDGVTYRRFTNTDNTTNTLVVGTTDFIVASSVSNRIVPLVNFASRYIRLEISGTVTGSVAPPVFKILCVSNQ